MNAKLIALMIVMSFSVGLVNAQNAVLTASAESPAISAVEWESASFDMGAIAQGIPVSHKFEFTNTGQEVIRIESVKASCGCTATDYSQGDIPPGETGYVLATYNAASPGFFHKSITVRLNTETGVSMLKIKGQVISAEETEPIGEE